MTNDLHLGRAIRAELKRQGKNARMLSEMIGKDHRTCYNILLRRHLNSRLLIDISRTLNHNFFALLEKAASLQPDDPKPAGEEEKLRKENEALRKELAYVKRINELLEKGSSV